MPAIVLVGAQWGAEGRGKATDLLGSRVDAVVTFNGGDPSNPDIVVSALWVAPDGTRIFADFNGPLKTGKVTLHSEPSKSENDILKLNLFGSDPGGRESGTEQAGSAAGG